MNGIFMNDFAVPPPSAASSELSPLSLAGLPRDKLRATAEALSEALGKNGVASQMMGPPPCTPHSCQGQEPTQNKSWNVA